MALCVSLEFRGRYHQIPRAFVGPQPVQTPHPPIYMAAYTPAAMRRVAQAADGWMPVGILLAAIPGLFAGLKQMARDGGRDAETLELVVRANLAFTERPLGADRSDFHGTLEQIGEDVARTRRLGATEVFFDLWTAHPDVDSVNDWLTRMEQL